MPEGFGEETVDLRTYRLRHTLYKLDPDLQAAHAKFPFAVIWDDHEVANDYSGLAPEFSSPSPSSRPGAPPPIRPSTSTCPSVSRVAQFPRNNLRIYRQLNFGRLAEFTMLDDRQYRTDNPCGTVGASLRGSAQRRLHDARTETGGWVADGFARSSARWNIVGQQLLLAELEHATIQDDWFWNDAWDGYPLARKRLLTEVVESRLRNPVFLTGDWHSTFVNDLKIDFKDEFAPTVATEFVTPAITTGGDGRRTAPITRR